MSGFNLRDLQKQIRQINPAARQREEQHAQLEQARLEAEEREARQRVEKAMFINSQLIQMNEALASAKQLATNIQNYMQSIANVDFRGQYNQALGLAGYLTQEIDNLRQLYHNYQNAMNDIQTRYDLNERVRLEKEYRYDIQFKELIKQLNMHIYQGLSSIQGLAHQSLNDIFKSVFDSLEDMGADHVELEVQNTDEDSLKSMAETLRGDGLSEGEIIEQLIMIYPIPPEYIMQILYDDQSAHEEIFNPPSQPMVPEQPQWVVDTEFDEDEDQAGPSDRYRY